MPRHDVGPEERIIRLTLAALRRAGMLPDWPADEDEQDEGEGEDED